MAEKEVAERVVEQGWQVFNAASLGATRITKAKKEVFNNFSFSLYLLSRASSTGVGGRGGEGGRVGGREGGGDPLETMEGCYSGPSSRGSIGNSKGTKFTIVSRRCKIFIRFVPWPSGPFTSASWFFSFRSCKVGRNLSIVFFLLLLLLKSSLRETRTKNLHCASRRLERERNCTSSKYIDGGGNCVSAIVAAR